MLALRRPQHEARVEIMPMIDVIFLLLTFFIYAMVLMVRAELLPMQLPELQSGIPATVAPTLAISVDRHAAVFLNKDPVTLDQLVQRLQTELDSDSDTVIYLAVEEGDDEKNQWPIVFSIMDALAGAKIDYSFVGRPPDDPASPESPASPASPPS